MEDFEHLNEEERLKAENDFLKMKMMLEHGAQFEKTENGNLLPADVENQFLRNIMEFEKQFGERKVTTVYDKLGKPTQFKPLNEIADDVIYNAWKELLGYMQEHGVDLSVSSPKVTAKELYRFTTEELFAHEIDDIHIPGMISGFIYDEFYPDYEYENTHCAVDDCISLIFQKDAISYMPHLGKKITLNDHQDLSQEKFKSIVNQFKEAFDDIVADVIEAENCTIEQTNCVVKGKYRATGFLGQDKLQLDDHWTVIFEFDDDLGYWQIVSVLIQGVSF